MNAKSQLTPYLRAYLECALWSSNDNADESGGESLDANYEIDDIAPESLAELLSAAESFRADNLPDLEASGLSESQWGHDFWLTRNRHGAGFWDRGLPSDLSRRLTDAAHAWGTVDLYVGDDGLLYV